MKKNKKVFVAMSGGVDSSVTAALLKQEGFEVTGITMCFARLQKNEKKKAGGSKTVEDARNVAGILNIKHYVVDMADDIERLVINDFINEYLHGRTPNPCVRCNKFIKFGKLLEKVRDLGGDYLATGHYAKLEFNQAKGIFELKKADDPLKDQSYFLWGLKGEILGSIMFPLGDKTKEEVKKLAKGLSLDAPLYREESQDICFISDEGYKAFIAERTENDIIKPGNFMNEKGDIVGEHKGIINYTIGQRDKLGIALGFPAYVYRIDKESNTVYVGSKDCLLSKGLVAKGVNFMSAEINEENIEVDVRIRYNAKEVKGVLSFINNNLIKIDFKEPQKAVTPGQSVVFYKGDVVLGGAIIKESIKNNQLS